MRRAWWILQACGEIYELAWTIRENLRDDLLYGEREHLTSEGSGEKSRRLAGGKATTRSGGLREIRPQLLTANLKRQRQNRSEREQSSSQHTESVVQIINN